MSIKAFANLCGVRMTTTQASQLGKRCAGLSRAGGRSIGTLPDETYGQVNAYDRDILQAVFHDVFGAERPVIFDMGAEA
jgi:predicted Rossmann-fold nucleotide-binding protein